MSALCTNVFGYSVSVSAKAYADVESEVRFGKWIVKRTICAVINNIHFRGPRDCCCNVQAKDERLHCVIREYTIVLFYARFQLDRKIVVVSRAQKCVPYQLRQLFVRTEDSLSLGRFHQKRFCVTQPRRYLSCRLRFRRAKVVIWHRTSLLKVHAGHSCTSECFSVE